MSLNIEGQKCPICNSYLFPEDDVVFCPACGAPHHRDCYNSLGHCGLEDTHGTEKQYDLLKKQEKTTAKDNNKAENTANTQICPNCKNKLTEDMLVCPYCGRPKNVRVFTLDLLGGIKPDNDLGGITAAEAKDFIQINSQRYIPKFEELKHQKFSWNWAAFLFPEGWFLSRKMYKLGAIFTAVMVAVQIFMLPLMFALNAAVFQTYNEYIDYFMQNLHSFGKAPLILAILGSVIMIITRIVSGLLGDKFYKSHVISRYSELKNSEDREIKIRKAGGVNIFAFLIGILISTYLPEIISMFL